MSTQSTACIVVFKDHATQDQIDRYAEQINGGGGAVTARYDSVLKGFAATLTASQLQSFQGDDIIQYIEPDQVITIAPPGSDVQ
ncbi:hypothetical protein M407DRAFT_243920 [Tulasnella calospora MUT 4182]|uniref:Inhibitor I9 domain-containing protein n=1 Tax=Tulasnella calospora MUT 4182 TaxID=1051891 RepID=A0A0C3KWW3_9AGAM|nr:hypothetical protein M407DRAFT_243920 [Tulasnella calospora MUT 4182]